MRARILLLALLVAPAASGCVCEEDRRVVDHVRYTIVHRHGTEHRHAHDADYERAPGMRWFPTELRRIEADDPESMVKRAPKRAHEHGHERAAPESESHKASPIRRKSKATPKPKPKPKKINRP